MEPRHPSGAWLRFGPILLAASLACGLPAATASTSTPAVEMPVAPELAKPPPAGETDAAHEYCAFGSLEAGTSLGYGCEDAGFRAFIDNDAQPWDIISGSTGESYADVVIEVDVRLIQGEDFSGAFVLCREQDRESFYYFKLFHDGVAIGEYNDGEEQTTRMGPLPAGTEPLATNRLRAECIGSRQALYVNGVLALERDDDTVTHGGVGLGAGEGEYGFTEVFFENWEVSQP